MLLNHIIDSTNKLYWILGNEVINQRHNYLLTAENRKTAINQDIKRGADRFGA